MFALRFTNADGDDGDDPVIVVAAVFITIAGERVHKKCRFRVVVVVFAIGVVTSMPTTKVDGVIDDVEEEEAEEEEDEEEVADEDRKEAIHDMKRAIGRLCLGCDSGSG